MKVNLSNGVCFDIPKDKLLTLELEKVILVIDLKNNKLEIKEKSTGLEKKDIEIAPYPVYPYITYPIWEYFPTNYPGYLTYQTVSDSNQNTLRGASFE